MKDFFKNPFFKFLTIFIVLISLWFLFYHSLYDFIDLTRGEESDSKLALSQNLAEIAASFNNLFGKSTEVLVQGDFVIAKLINKPLSHGVWIGEPCNGLKLMGLFAIFILSFAGKWKHKIWFIPAGLLTIHIINAIRISALSLIEASYPELLDFNHKVTFQILIYGIIFIMWYVWVKFFSEIELKKQSD